MNTQAKLDILVVGSGGREHAIIHALKRSPRAGKIYAAAGNAGIAQDAELVALKETDGAAIVQFCKDKQIGLVMIGPEAPLVAGVADDLRAANIPVFGPSQKAAMLEGSKRFMKECLVRYNIPTATHASFTDKEKAIAYVRAQGAPIVVKTDGLAAGKGVTVAMSVQEAIDAIEENFAGRFGDAGKTLVIEEFLDGEEVSFFAICDGATAIAFGAAQDHKAVGDGDTGPNTGGMGTYSPAPVLTDALHQRIMDEIIAPTMLGLQRDGMPYTGVLFAGVMVDKAGNPKLLEYNVRFGDPETQVMMMRLESDLVTLLHAAATGALAGHEVKMKPQAALCVVMASKGYPGDYHKGTVIEGIENAAALDDVKVFHAGTARKDGAWLANGGRVLGVTALGDDVAQAQARAYQAVDAIHWPEGFCRRDIGWRAIARMKKAS